ncbi:hypothetical protein [Mucilaginibacter defluvii]|uniref:YD repeat-containing protein n=1 Tax=Mucilaginibacter defluvii TaxID=1196019 RepID=A0ABP9GD80_9SPHI
MKKTTVLLLKVLLALLLLPCVQLLHAQPYGPNLNTEIPKIIPPTPEAAAIEKFGVVPVNYSTGVPNISYPFWSWKRGKLEFSLGLSYHAGGNKVEDMAPSTGLGWALTGLGRVSRTIRGLPDDDPAHGFMYMPVLPQIALTGYTGGYHFTSSQVLDQQSFSPLVAITQYNVPYSDTVKQLVEGWLDGEQDIFSFSCSGGSGRFIFDKQKNIIPLELTNVKIQPLYAAYSGGQPSGSLSAFIITDDKGLVYTFDFREEQASQSFSETPALSGSGANTQGTCGWLLTKILDPNTKDSITIQYTNSQLSTNPVKYEGGFSESQVYQITEAAKSIQQVIPHRKRESYIYSHQVISSLNPVPVSVSFPDGSTVQFEHNFSRDDYTGTKALSGITVKDYNNATVKKFSLNYSYFIASGNVPNFPLAYGSGNDYSKRLRLDNVTELSKDGLLSKPTTFTYNSLPLNPRYSNNLDLWGYNVDPARNNAWKVPEFQLEDEEYFIDTTYGRWVEGGNRAPDSIYVKAGVLEKITYPTGGFTSFEYECNRAFSSLNYYVDKKTSNSLAWQSYEFGNSYNISLPGRVASKIDFLFKAQEYGPRPVPDPNAPQPCFENQQDVQNASIDVYSTDLSVNITVSVPYGEMLNGAKRELDLPLGKTYKVRFNYDTTILCGYSYPFQATAIATYHIPLQDKLAGGLRVKKITANDGGGRTVAKQYSYNLANGNSSATLTRVNNYQYHRTGLDETDLTYADAVFYHTKHINNTSNPTQTMTFLDGSPLVYTHVTEQEIDGAVTERDFDPVVMAAGGNGNYPYAPVQDIPNFSGLLTKQVVKDKYGAIKSEQTITYSKTDNSLISQVDNRNLKAGTISSAIYYNCTYYVAEQYFMHVTYAEEASNTLKTFENGIQKTVTTAKEYNGQHYLRTVSTTTSTGEDRKYTTYYASDVTNPLYSDMFPKNMLNYPVESKSAVPPEQTNGTLLRTLTNYGLYNSNTLIAPATLQRSIQGSTPETELTFDAYDDKGNLLQYTAKDGVPVAFIYGYHKTYPVAKIAGSTYANAISTSGIDLNVLDNPAGDNALRTELNKLRTYLTGSTLVSTYTYAPQVGTTSETDPTGKTMYYEYDSYNRLKLVRDKDNNILKKLCYNYLGQQTDCTETIVTNGPAPDMCSPASCWGPNQKCINGVCETGVKYYTASVQTGPNAWECTYSYHFSDNTLVGSYTEMNAMPCLIFED